MLHQDLGFLSKLIFEPDLIGDVDRLDRTIADVFLQMIHDIIEFHHGIVAQLIEVPTGLIPLDLNKVL